MKESLIRAQVNDSWLEMQHLTFEYPVWIAFSYELQKKITGSLGWR